MPLYASEAGCRGVDLKSYAWKYSYTPRAILGLIFMDSAISVSVSERQTVTSSFVFSGNNGLVAFTPVVAEKSINFAGERMICIFFLGSATEPILSICL